jgi:hypothetical protein
MVLMASVLVFMFYAPGLIFGGTEGIRSSFHVLRSRTHIGRYRGRQIQCSYFALSDSSSAVPTMPSPVLMFCTPGFISTVPGALGPVFMFCASRLIFGGTDDAGSNFHILRSRTHFMRNRGPTFHILRFRTQFWRYRERWV